MEKNCKTTTVRDFIRDNLTNPFKKYNGRNLNKFKKLKTK